MRQITRQCRQSFVLLISGETKFDHDVTLDKVGVFQTLTDRGLELWGIAGRLEAEEPDDRQARLLCTRRERPRSRRAAERSNEFPPCDVDCHRTLQPRRAKCRTGRHTRNGARSAIRHLESRSLQWAEGVLSTYLRAHYRCEREGIHKPRPGAHAELVAALSGHSPRPIPIDADAIDLEDRADQLNKVLNALSAYLTAVLDDTAQNVPGGLDLRKVDALLFDLASDKPPWCTRSNPHTRSGAAAAPTNALRLLGIHQHEDDAHGSLPWLSQA